MKGCMKAEIYKLIYNKYIYFSISIVMFMAMVCYFGIEEENRTANWVHYFSYIFLFISNFVVGSIISNEYEFTLKDLVLAAQNRKSVFISKVISCMIGIHFIYMVYILSFIVVNHNFIPYMFLNQYIAVMQHTIGLIAIAIIIKSFSILSLMTIIMLCIYREMSSIQGTSLIESILKYTYHHQFTEMDIMFSFNYVFWCVVVLSLGIGYFLFKHQDIK